MRRITIAALGAVLLGSAALAAPQDDTVRDRAIVTRFADIFYHQKDVKRAFDEYVAPGYIQHNPNIPDGRDAAIAWLTPRFSKPGVSFQITQILVDGNLAVIHLHARPNPGAPGGAVADFYRLDHGKIVEHWDVLQPVPTKSVNPHPMF